MAATTAPVVLLQHLHSELAAAPAIADQVLLLRDRPTALDVDTEVSVGATRLAGQQYALTLTPTDWTMNVAIAMRARGSGTGVTAVERLDTVLAEVWERLDGITWPRGVSGRLDVDLGLDFTEAGDLLAEAQLALQIVFRTASGSLALPT